MRSVAPNADQEVHGEEHDFPEDEEEEEVERKKNADHAGFEDQQHDEKFFDAGVDAVPGAEYRERSSRVVRRTRNRLMPSTPRW